MDKGRRLSVLCRSEPIVKDTANLDSTIFNAKAIPLE